ncbi:MAG: Asp-tRNA(Asn)/Glu-tRNA(Gln) amidotransferase subunit GatA, partial [Rhodospirillaceae bacterium]|nr:Asp-tRNA(Asn)/Glu-tRNA(Gln) amidotransferase subunit GatA [Rhodospirillaceae bacterium]
MTDLTSLTLAGARDGLAKGDFTSVELTQAFLSAMAAHKDLNAYIVDCPDVAMDRAKASDVRRAKGEALGPMDGAPVAIKDLFCTEGVQTTAASRILEGFTPQYECTVSGKLKAGGAVMLGKTNLDEFAMGSANITSAYGNVISPWTAEGDDAPLVPGGSSGGSATAVSARLCLAATGTDTGGSIRQPAAFTGIVGLKPTYGRCSRWGIVAFASSLDQAGPMTRTVQDAAIMLGQMAGFDAKDSTSANVALPDVEKALT